MQKKNDLLSLPLTVPEQVFATENHGVIEQYLRIRKLPVDDWYDVVIFRYLRAVKRWFADPGLHKYSFKTIAYGAMRSAIWGELERRKKEIKAISLDDEIPGTEGLTYADIVTEENLEYIYVGGNDMQLSYNVELPARNTFRGGAKSDEVKAIEAFITGTWKNMCFKYDTPEEAKRWLSCIQSYRRKENHKELYDVYRSETCVYVVRMENPEPKKAQRRGGR